MKRFSLVVLVLMLVGMTAQAQRAEQILYRDSLDASGNVATATTSALGYEVFKNWRSDFTYYVMQSLYVKFTKIEDSVKLQAAVTNFGEDTTWVDIKVRNTLTATASPGAGGFGQVRDTLRTWVTQVGVDGGVTMGPFFLEPEYIGRKIRAVSGVLDTGKTYINQAMKTPL